MNVATPAPPDPDGPQTFWERRPWLGFAVFMGIVGLVGITLISVIEIRPHYRDWTFVTKVPPPGSGLPGPSYAETAPQYANDPVSMEILATVEDGRERPLGHREVVLTRKGDTDPIAWGITESLGGSIHFRVPGRFDQDLFAQALQTILLTPGEGMVVGEVMLLGEKRSPISTIDTPEAGTRLEFTVEGLAPEAAARLFVAPAGGVVNARSRGWRIVQGRAVVGGLRPGRSYDLILRVASFPEITHGMTIPEDAGESHAVTIPPPVRGG
jgi:hypothetical protein